ncbi:poly(rC)-binding protein 3 isoform X2 [Strongylocentrotus purpuratus]|uniref:K Homology domain-containing protein n=1 Tax=Strongylocentrotus purpuratus TaxID=7668 RepID=A0A7M7N241_STRPU|nr:poly(rC)-binding protein 3 isoform X2 [Strongylocentrotus purpuratus]
MFTREVMKGENTLTHCLIRDIGTGSSSQDLLGAFIMTVSISYFVTGQNVSKVGMFVAAVEDGSISSISDSASCNVNVERISAILFEKCSEMVLTKASSDSASGARINISDGSCPERIVTITGSPEAINLAFKLITKKFDEDLSNSVLSPGTPKPPVSLRLIVPTSQCGSLIGKGGSKIKDIRETTSASITVASEMLPSSTERAVTISGTPEAITKAIYQVCCVMLESPPKGATIPYRPKPATAPIIFAGGSQQQAYAVHGNYALAQPDLTKLHHQLALHHQQTPYAIPGQTPFSPAALTQFAAQTAAPPPQVQGQATTQEITIPNHLIGCVIGRGGTKIQEIRQMSGANIKIANSQEGSTDRSVTITGSPESVAVAQCLINTSLELAKGLTFDPSTFATGVTSSSSSKTSPSLVSSPLTSATLSANPLTLLPSTINNNGTAVGTVTTTAPTHLTIPLNNLLKTVPMLNLEAAGQLVKSTYATKMRASAANSSKKFTPY